MGPDGTMDGDRVVIAETFAVPGGASAGSVDLGLGRAGPSVHGHVSADLPRHLGRGRWVRPHRGRCGR